MQKIIVSTSGLRYAYAKKLSTNKQVHIAPLPGGSIAGIPAIYLKLRFSFIDPPFESPPLGVMRSLVSGLFNPEKCDVSAKSVRVVIPTAWDRCLGQLDQNDYKIVVTHILTELEHGPLASNHEYDPDLVDSLTEIISPYLSDSPIAHMRPKPSEIVDMDAVSAFIKKANSMVPGAKSDVNVVALNVK